ncbi:MAG: peptidoglycan-binding protein [Acidimicrobiales bacterium]
MTHDASAPDESASEGAIDLDEEPLFVLDETHEPDLDGEEGQRGGSRRQEGVDIPFDVAEYGNGLLPDSLLQRIGVSWHRLHPAAAAGFQRLRNQAQRAGIDLTCTDSYRTLDQQVALKRAKPQWSATPGRSVHGWGFAVDLSIGMPQKPFGHSVLNWLKANGPGLGWHLGRPKDEPWHWVYRGDQTLPAGSTDASTSTTSTTGGAAGTATDTDDDGLSDATTAAAGNDEVTIGSRGWGVKILHGLLGVPDSATFDATTDAAVRRFQTDNGLAVDGRVGPQTWAALRRVTAPVERPTLRRGSTGDPVPWVQRRLGCAPDGDFGPRTEAHVLGFQRARSLSVDGIVGPQTWTSLTA